MVISKIKAASFVSTITHHVLHLNWLLEWVDTQHKDADALTVLAQDDAGGLDVKRKSDGEWVRVKPIPDSYIINVGDIIQLINQPYHLPSYELIILPQLSITEKKKEETMEVMKKHFVLVHGSCHGAWCWYKLTTLLRSEGHRVTVLDLSASGINPKQALDLQSISDYSQPLMKFMDSLPTTAAEKVILIAHSFGGVSVSEAMEGYPEKISVAVFVAAFMGGPELNVLTLSLEYLRRYESLMDSVYTFDNGPENTPTTFIFGPNFMSSDFYQLCPPEDITLATMLARPMPIFGEDKSSKEVALTHERYGSVKRVYIVADEDKALKKDFQGWMIEKNPTDEVKEITGSDHMVMLSKPRELFSFLQEIAANYN